MSKPMPLESLSRSCRFKTPIQRGPDYPEILQERDIGGPEDHADRRLILDVPLLTELLEVARSSLSQRVVIHRVGLRVQVVDNGQHRWEHIRLIGLAPEPELRL